jgi:hypothetical protein
LNGGKKFEFLRMREEGEITIIDVIPSLRILTIMCKHVVSELILDYIGLKME